MRDITLADQDLLTRTLDVMHHMVLPVITLAPIFLALYSRLCRASMLEVLGSDYIRTAKAKGLRHRRFVSVHTLRNSLIPVVTVIALGVPQIFGGAIITETLFKVNGIGQLLLTALFANDLPMVMTLPCLVAFLIVMVHLIADILYGLLDPRIRYD